MRRATKRLIRNWVKLGTRYDADFFHPWDTTSTELRFMDERIAYRMNRHSTEVIILEPPSFWGLRSVQRSLHRLLTRNKVPVVYMQPNQYIDAGIRTDTITVLDTGRLPRNKTKATDVLFRADVTPRWGDRVLRNGLFISGFDENEKRGGYFLCEVADPDRQITTLEQAYAALKPDAVKQAEDYGRTVIRQGDLYFIPMPEYVPDGDLEGLADGRGIFGTNHIAAKMIWGGQHDSSRTAYVRGTIRHRPVGRRPDHAPVSLGETWHMVVKNLVPIEVRESTTSRIRGSFRTERNWI